MLDNLPSSVDNLSEESKLDVIDTNNMPLKELMNVDNMPEEMIDFEYCGYTWSVLKQSLSDEMNKKLVEAIKNGTLSECFDFSDMHSHTSDTDAFVTPEELIDNAVLNGVTILAVTDHNCTVSAVHAKKYADEKYGDKIRVILAEEQATLQGHLLVYFGDIDVMKKVEEKFPFLTYTNERVDEMKNNYTEYYETFLKEAPPVDSIVNTLRKLNYARYELFLTMLDKLEGEGDFSIIKEKIYSLIKYNFNDHKDLLVKETEKIINRKLTEEEINSFTIFTSAAHPTTTPISFAKLHRMRGLAHMGGIGTSQASYNNGYIRHLIGRYGKWIDAYDLYDDAVPETYNKDSIEYAKERDIVSFTTSSDTRFADPRTMMLVPKDGSFFNDIQNGSTIIIQRKKDDHDKKCESLLQKAWFDVLKLRMDYYMEEQITPEDTLDELSLICNDREFLNKILLASDNIRYKALLFDMFRKVLFQHCKEVEKNEFQKLCVSTSDPAIILERVLKDISSEELKMKIEAKILNFSEVMSQREADAPDWIVNIVRHKIFKSFIGERQVEYRKEIEEKASKLAKDHIEAKKKKRGNS